MPVTDRMILGAIASNPGNYDGPGVYRYSIPQQTIYFTNRAKPDPKDREAWFELPALNPDGSKRMEQAFQQFIKRRWLPSRQQELEQFARRAGWDLAMELRDGGGGLSEEEFEEWQIVVKRELDRLTAKVRAQIK